METSHTQTAYNTISLPQAKIKALKLLLKELKNEALKGDFSWGALSSVVDCTTFLIEFLEGRHNP